MFEEILKEKKDLPRMKAIEKEMGKYEYNGYQKFSLVAFIICFALGIVFGNLFPTCSSTNLYTDTCTSTEFNFFLMTAIWFISFLVCLFFFGMGHIISLLSSIDEKMGKRM